MPKVKEAARQEVKPELKPELAKEDKPIKARVSSKEFIDVLFTSKSVAEVTEKLNMTSGNVYQRMNKLKQLGEPLPVFERSRSKESKEELIEYIRSWNQKIKENED